MRITLFLLALSFGGLTYAQVPSIVEDLRLDNEDGASSAPQQFASGATKIFFVATTAESGEELWVSDGTETGTRIVRDIRPGTLSSSINHLTVVGDIAYFEADDGVFGLEPWRSDGTEAGTYMLADIGPGGARSEADHFHGARAAVLFTVDNSGLWRTDGTTAGTMLVLSIAAPTFGPLYGLTDKSCFQATYPGITTETWCTDGTDDGTILVASENFRGHVVGALDSVLLFRFQNRLWKTDGTVTGTTLLLRVDPEPGVRVGDRLVFEIDRDDELLGALVSSNGLQGDLELIAPTTFIRDYAHVDSGLYFLAPGNEVWFTDGTGAGTKYLFANDDISPSVRSIRGLTGSGEQLLLQLADDVVGEELYISDGTLAGTSLLRDIHPGVASSRAPSNHPELVAFLGGFVFAARDGLSGFEPWISNGTESGTVRLADVEPRAGALPRSLTGLGDRVYFVADNGASGDELFSSDGTVVTGPETDLVPAVNGIDPFGRPAEEVMPLVSTDDSLYFTERFDVPGARGAALWVHDATTGLETKLADIADSPGDPLLAVPFGAPGEIIFLNSTSDHVQLWRSDGTIAATQLAVDFGPSAVFLFEMTSTPTWMPLSLFTQPTGVEVWRSDGTDSGTSLVFDSPSELGLGGAWPRFLTPAGDSVYYSGRFDIPRELWRSDGTEAGTMPITDVGTPSGPDMLTASGENLYFTLFDDASGSELWFSDGTETGTARVRDVRPGSASAAIVGITTMGGRAFFQANDGVHGSELWVSDATASGTRMVRDIAIGAGGSAPAELTVFGDWLVFSADDGSTGRELWVSDGTHHGTIRLADLVVGPAGSVPRELTVAGQRLFFSAEDATHDVELYSVGTLTDVDQDGVGATDNCTTEANPGQLDADGDGFGNACDPDLNNDCRVNFADLALFKVAYLSSPGSPQWNPAADFNADDIVDLADLATMRDHFFAPPGPSLADCPAG